MKKEKNTTKVSDDVVKSTDTVQPTDLPMDTVDTPNLKSSDTFDDDLNRELIVSEFLTTYPDGSSYTVRKGEFSNVGTLIQKFKDNQPQFDDEERPIFDVKRGFDVLFKGFKIGRFKLPLDSIDWTIIKLTVNHYTDDTSGQIYPWFTCFSKEDSIVDVTNFINHRDRLDEIKEQY